MKLDKLATHKAPTGPVLVVVVDGVGIAPDSDANAVTRANTPVLDSLLQSELSTHIFAHGTHVGLPTDNDMGNSEVGHNTLGGGRIFDQGAKLVNHALESGALFRSEAWQQIESRANNGGTIHFLGLLSDGNVHSSIAHLLQLLSHCQQQGFHSIRIHALLDGRDVAPRSAIDFVAQLNEKLADINQHASNDYQLASVGGRMVITMDRYEANWQMVERGYATHVHGDAPKVQNAIDEIQRQYDADAAINDQYIEPFVLVDEHNEPVGRMQDGDGVVLFNFRGDRAIEISQALDNDAFDKFNRGNHPDIFFCGMLEYDGDLHVPQHYLVPPPKIDGCIAQYLCAQGVKSFAVSETQKFGHVTFFWNGNRSDYFNKELETYIEIPSDNIQFNQAPAMKAQEITDTTIELLQSGQYQYGRINFANGDMVGHTGDIAATISAIETVDGCIGQLMDAITEVGGILIVTADHGNADEMFVEKNGQRVSRTSHTLNPVPFAIFDPQHDGSYTLKANDNFGLANVAATSLNLMGFAAPKHYFPSMITFAKEPIDRHIIHEGAKFSLGLETVKMPNDEVQALEVVRHPGGVVIIPLGSDAKICLLKQFRHALGQWIWEFPAGTLEPREATDISAARELHEETGCSANEWTYLGEIITAPGFCSEILHLYLAEDLTLGEQHTEPGEFIETYWMSIEEAMSLAYSGEMNDAKSIVALFRLQHYLAQN